MLVFFSIAPATAKIYTYCPALSLHDSLPVCPVAPSGSISCRAAGCGPPLARASPGVLAAHPRLGGALGFLGSDGGTDGFYLPTTVFGWTVRISRRNDVCAARRRRDAVRPPPLSRRHIWLLACRRSPRQQGTTEEARWRVEGTRGVSGRAPRGGGRMNKKKNR